MCIKVILRGGGGDHFKAMGDWHSNGIPWLFWVHVKKTLLKFCSIRCSESTIKIILPKNKIVKIKKKLNLQITLINCLDAERETTIYLKFLHMMGY